ncbi:uncharacterized protein LOC144925444 [Branchiostoma floridae x Branchiostoma belcheri]
MGGNKCIQVTLVLLIYVLCLGKEGLTVLTVQQAQHLTNRFERLKLKIDAITFNVSRTTLSLNNMAAKGLPKIPDVPLPSPTSPSTTPTPTPTPGDPRKIIFPGPRDTDDYARMETILSEELLSFTLCVHMRSNMDSSNGISLVSYAVPEDHNELLLFVDDGFELNVQSYIQMADPPVWDGEWHVICTTWRSSDGAWQLYADGVLIASGSGFDVGGRVRRGGTWILGQDQDEVGGGFQAHQSFIGELSEVNLWDRVLSPAEIGAECSYHGNVIDWDTTDITVFGQASRAEYQCVLTTAKFKDCLEDDGASYRGTVSVTETGRTCQRWDSQTPHGHDRTAANHPLSGLEQNYCRNPDHEPTLWCYTTDPRKRWEFCDVTHCDGQLVLPTAQVKDCMEGDGASYRGTVSVTETGRTCQRWDSQTPHGHTKTAANWPSSGLDQNYCRNPDHEPTLWCFTTDPRKRWEFCDVPHCDGHLGVKVVSPLSNTSQGLIVEEMVNTT